MNFMKYILASLVLLLASSITFSQSSSDILGVWITEDRDAKIEIYKKGEEFFGKIIWVQTAGVKDTKNPDASLRNQSLVGLNILTNFKSDGTNKWSEGKIYDPNNGKTYSCNIKLNNGKLDIRGYVGISLFGRTSTWTRN
jgi:uncharacterized protein (DUF2147 family)